MTPDPSFFPLLLGASWPDDDPGGMHRYVAELLAALRAGGDPVTSVVLGPARGAPVGVVATVRADSFLPWRLWRYWRTAERAMAGAGLVDAHFALYALGPVVLGKLRRLPLVVHFHGPWAEESAVVRGRSSWDTRVRRWIEASVYRRAAHCVTLSGAFKAALVERYGIPPWRVSVLPPGVDLLHFLPGDRAAARRHVGLPDGARVAVAVRRLVPRMGLDTLIEAWVEVVERLPDALLVIAGDGPERSVLEMAAGARGLAPSVRFLGRVDEEALVACYQAADVSVVPSRELEGYGLVVLESLACGTPVVASDVGGLAEALRPFDPSLVVPAGDPSALAARVAEVLGGGGPDREACRHYAESFGWDRVARRTSAVYRDAVVGPTRRRLRVVYLSHSAALSGGELALLRLLPALQDVDAHVLLAEDGPLREALRQAGVSVELLPLAEAARELRRDRVRPFGVPAGVAWHSAAHVARVAARLRQLRPDLVHTNSLKAGLYGSLAGRLARIPVVWHLRDRIADDYLPGPAVRLIRAAISRLPAGVVANSSSTLATAGRLRMPSAVVASPVAVATGASPAAREGPLRVGMVGRLAPWKGQHLFLEAFSKAFPGGDERAVVVGAALFGEDAYAEELRRQVDELGMADRVDWRGFRPDIGAELARLDVLVNASVIAEPFGQVVVEGMAAGLPVLAGDAGGPREVISRGVNGVLYPVGDVAALSSALVALSADPAERRRLGEAARKRAADYAPEVVAAEMTAFYRRVVPAPGGASG